MTNVATNLGHIAQTAPVLGVCQDLYIKLLRQNPALSLCFGIFIFAILDLWCQRHSTKLTLMLCCMGHSTYRTWVDRSWTKKKMWSIRSTSCNLTGEICNIFNIVKGVAPCEIACKRLNPRPGYGRAIVTLTSKSAVKQILWCYHWNETSLDDLLREFTQRN